MLKSLQHSWNHQALLLVLVSMLGGCGTTNSSHFNYRFGPTGLEPSDRIAAIEVIRHGSDGHPYWAHSDCVESVLSRELRSNAVVRGSELLKLFSSRNQTPPIPVPLDHGVRKLDNFGEWLLEPDISFSLSQLNIRYVVEIEAAGFRGDSRAETSFIHMGLTRLRIAEFTARILDIKNRAVVGAVKSSAASESGGGLAIIGFLPVPYFQGSSVHEPACMEVAQGVADLIIGAPGQ